MAKEYKVDYIMAGKKYHRDLTDVLNIYADNGWKPILTGAVKMADAWDTVYVIFEREKGYKKVRAGRAKSEIEEDDPTSLLDDVKHLATLINKDEKEK